MALNDTCLSRIFIVCGSLIILQVCFRIFAKKPNGTLDDNINMLVLADEQAGEGIVIWLLLMPCIDQSSFLF
jgi:hypothetical protein